MKFKSHTTSLAFFSLVTTLCFGSENNGSVDELDKSPPVLNYGISYGASSNSIFQSSNETLTVNLGGRFPITKQTTATVSIRGELLTERFYAEDGPASSTDKEFRDIKLGITHDLDIDKIPIDLSINSSVDFISRSSNETHIAENISVGTTISKLLDPVELSLDITYEHRNNYRLNGTQINPGNTLYLSPSLSFRINDVVSVDGGAQLVFTKASVFDGEELSIRENYIEWTFGLGYAATEKTRLYLNYTSDESGDKGSTISLNLSCFCVQ